jgi:hypothetical protein
MKMNKKAIGVLILLLAAGFIIYAGWSIELSPWLLGAMGGAIGLLLGGPIGALIGIFGGVVAAGILLKILAVILTVWTLILAFVVFVVDEDKTMWVIGLWFFSTAFIICLLLPGPLPFWAGEIMTAGGSALTGVKVLRNGSGQKQIGVF